MRRSQAIALQGRKPPSIHWSPKQKRVFDLFEQAYTYYYLSGSVRSGKTYVGLFAFLDWVARTFRGHYFLLGARRQRLMNTVILANVIQWCQNSGAFIHKDDDVYAIQSTLGGFNTFIPSLGSNENSEEDIMGITASGAYLDQPEHMPQSYVDQVGLRCSVDGAKVVFSNNPSGPLHWLKTEYIDKEAETNGVHVSFELADNPSLSKAYVDRIMRQYSGVFYRRMVLGEWVATTGSVYPNAEVSFKDPPGDPVYRYYISVDVASSGVTHAALWAEYSSGRSWALKEWRHDGQEQGQLSDAKQVEKVYDALIGDKPIYEIYPDPAAASWRAALRDLGLAKDLPWARRIYPAENDVIEGIQMTTKWIDNDWMNIGPACPHLRKEIVNYLWDEKAGARGDDRPVKAMDHGPDMARYYCYTRAIRGSRAKAGFH